MRIYQYSGKCWWCSSEANSREHKYKKSEIVQEAGSGPYKGDSSLIRISNGKDCEIKGPKSIQVKYEKNICQNCNNAKSQDFDMAYDRFIKFIKTNEDIIIGSQTFSFKDIYCESWQQQVENLKRYYIKFICCRLAEADVFIHPDVRRYLNREIPLKYFALHMSIMRDVTIMKKYFFKNGSQLGISHGDLKCIMNRKKNYLRNIQSYYQYRWFRLSYIYDRTITGLIDNFSRESVYLPFIEKTESYNILFRKDSTQPR